MVTIKAAWLVVAVGAALVAACGSSPKTTEAPQAEGADQSVSNQNAAPKAGGVECAAEVLLECGPGTVDGCTLGLTLVHACVPKDAMAGPPCEQELAKVCPEHQMDGCLMSPPTTATHVCVTQ